MDAVSGEASTPAAAATTTVAAQAGGKHQDGAVKAGSAQTKDNGSAVKANAGQSQQMQQADQDGTPKQPEVKFFLWEFLKSIFSFFEHLF